MTHTVPTAASDECVLVCIGASPASERLVRAAHALAESMNVAWHAVHVALATPLSAADRDRVETHLALAESLGAEVAYVVGSSIAESLLDYARDHGVTRIVAGKPMRSRWRLSGRLIEALIRDSGAIEVHVIAPHEFPSRAVERRRIGAWPYVHAAVAVVIATAIGIVADSHVSLPDQAMIYLFAIMIAALGGRGPGVLAAATSVAAYNFFFIPPRYTLAVTDLDHVMTFAVMFTVGIGAGTLVARLRHAAALSRQRERRTSALLAFTAKAAAARTIADVASAAVTQVEDALHARAVVLLRRDDGSLERDPVDMVAIPLWDGESSVGVLGVQLDDARGRIGLDARALLEGLARQAGVAIARLRLAREAEEAALRANAEEVRSSLLSTVSHDLRTPLAIISGMASSLREGANRLTPEQLEAVDTIADESERLGSMLHNLLAMTRVESGAGLRRDWVPLEELVGSALGRCETLLSSHELEVHVDDEAGVRVEPVLFEQMLINLVENATKHTPPGTPIDVRGRRTGDEVIIEVSDRGPGLPPGPPERLFEKFVRGPGVRTNGAGLGLAVCRGIAQAHGGWIEAEQRDGGGAIFRVHMAAGMGPRNEDISPS